MTARQRHVPQWRPAESEMGSCVPGVCQIQRGTTGNTGVPREQLREHRVRSVAGQSRNYLSSTLASQAEGSSTVSTCRPSWLALVDSSGSVVEVGGRAARHTRAWSVGAPAIMADCRRLGFVPQPCQMQGSATVNTGGTRTSNHPLPQPTKPQLNPQITQPLS
jgi:hypothetical protein